MGGNQEGGRPHSHAPLRTTDKGRRLLALAPCTHTHQRRTHSARMHTSTCFSVLLITVRHCTNVSFIWPAWGRFAKCSAAEGGAQRKVGSSKAPPLLHTLTTSKEGSGVVLLTHCTPPHEPRTDSSRPHALELLPLHIVHQPGRVRQHEPHDG